MKIKLRLSCLLILIQTSAQATDVNVPIDKSQSGSLYVEAVINSNIRSQFLVDTGAGMVTLNRELFEQISESGKVEKTGEIAARLANGKYETMNLYKVQSFSIGENCNLGEMEVAVMKRAGRNILGLSALTTAAPFTVHTKPLALVLSGCPFYKDSIAENRTSKIDKIAVGEIKEDMTIHLTRSSNYITSTTSPSFFLISSLNTTENPLK